MRKQTYHTYSVHWKFEYPLNSPLEFVSTCIAPTKEKAREGIKDLIFRSIRVLSAERENTIK